MEQNITRFFIIGDEENIMYVLNKLPNKNKLYSNYLFDIEEPFVEYGFVFCDEENTQFKIIVCPQNLKDNIFDHEYFKDVSGLIICHDLANYNYKNIIEKINAKENIHIWFNDLFDINEQDSHFVYTDNGWLNRIYNHIQMPFTAPIYYCNIL